MAMPDPGNNLWHKNAFFFMALSVCLGLAIHPSHAYYAQVHDSPVDQVIDWSVKGNAADHLPPTV